MTQWKFILRRKDKSKSQSGKSISAYKHPFFHYSFCMALFTSICHFPMTENLTQFHGKAYFFNTYRGWMKKAHCIDYKR